MSKVLAKFQVTKITRFSGWQGVSIELTPVYSDDPKHENKKFWDATPSGKIELGIKSEAAEAFVLGKEYYVTFEQADGGTFK